MGRTVCRIRIESKSRPDALMRVAESNRIESSLEGRTLEAGLGLTHSSAPRSELQDLQSLLLDGAEVVAMLFTPTEDLMEFLHAVLVGAVGDGQDVIDVLVVYLDDPRISIVMMAWKMPGAELVHSGLWQPPQMQSVHSKNRIAKHLQ